VRPLVVAVRAERPAGDRVEGDAAHAPAAAERRRPRISLTEVIFKVFCLIIAAFCILLFGIIGGALYLTS
jgi:hypothetical protein